MCKKVQQIGSHNKFKPQGKSVHAGNMANAMDGGWKQLHQRLSAKRYLRY